MAKAKTNFSCQECGGTSTKWQGKCPSCGAWNTLVEGVAEVASAGTHRFTSLVSASELAVLGEIEAKDTDRTPTSQDELDRVLGGGLV